MNKTSITKLILLLCILLLANIAGAQTITVLQQGKATSIRGLSVVDDSIAWISGSKGTVALTRNGGKSWDWQQVKGFEKADFRDIVAFSNKEAIIMSSGTPALILKTIDGGASWQLKYQNADTAYFFDAMDFDGPKHGLVLGDPIKGKFVLMETKDGGENWLPFSTPPDARPNEAAFAASGTCLRFENDQITIVTGGAVSRELMTTDNTSSITWLYNDLQVKHGKSAQGAFSISADGKVVVGGDYQHDHLTDSVITFVQYNGTYAGSGMYISKTPPSGYQSCVEFLFGNTYLSTGTPGSNITTDGGQTWKQIDAQSYNVCRKAKHGKLALLAGNKGTIGMLNP